MSYWDGHHLWLRVTTDRLRHIIIEAETCEELATLCGVDKSTIQTSIKRHGATSPYEHVIYDDPLPMQLTEHYYPLPRRSKWRGIKELPREDRAALKHEHDLARRRAAYRANPEKARAKTKAYNQRKKLKETAEKQKEQNKEDAYAQRERSVAML